MLYIVVMMIIIEYTVRFVINYVLNDFIKISLKSGTHKNNIHKKDNHFKYYYIFKYGASL